MHVIVGQGQLDSILHATPEDRRGFIEEAAGVLKHRKRKEKALRKLDSTEGNLTRLSRPARRDPSPAQAPGPPGRGGPAGAVGAGRRPRRPGPADGRRPGRGAHRAGAGARRRVGPAGAPRRGRGSPGRRPARPRPPSRRRCARTCRRWPSAQETWFGLSGLRERLRGTAGLAAERVRNAASQPEVPAGRDPDELEAEAARVRAQEEEITAEVAANRTALDGAVSARQAAEQAFAEEERRVAGLQRAAADRREGMARLHGQVNGLRSRAAAAEEEVGRLTEARAEIVSRAERAQHDFTSLESRVAGLDAGEEGLDAEHEAASCAALRHRGPAGQEPRGAHRRRAGAQLAQRAQGGARARAEPQGRRRRPAGRHRLGQRAARLGGRTAQRPHGLRGGRRRGPRERGRRRRRTRRRLGDRRHRPPQGRRPGPGRASCSAVPRSTTRPGRACPAARRTPMDVVECPADLRPALARLLHKVVVVDDLATAQATRPRRSRPDRGHPRRRPASAPTSLPAAPRASRA